MFIGYQNQLSKSISYSKISHSGSSMLLTEPKQVSLQREVDAYTRKVEQEKRRLYSIEETYAIVEKEYKERKERKNQIKKKEQDTETKLLKTKIQNLQNKIEQMIAKHNQAQTENNVLKEQIDKLRKERQSYFAISQQLQEEVHNTNAKTEMIVTEIHKSISRTKKAEDEILVLKRRNDDEKKNYYRQFDVVQQKVIEDKRQRNESKVIARRDKFDVQIDLHGVMKQRLKKLIFKNKEKVKVIEQYQKIMKIIDEAFQQIMEGSGITDIQEITNTFIKSEEQNYSLYKYVDILLQDIDYHTDLNADLERRCKEQAEENETRERLLAGTPTEEKTRRKLVSLTQRKEERINAFRETVREMKPDMEKILIELAKSAFNRDEKKQKLFDYELGFDLTENNFEQYLSDLEEYINVLIEFKAAQNAGNTNHTFLIDEIPAKDFRSTRVLTKPPSPDEYMLQEEKRLLDQSTLQEIAVKALERRQTQPATSTHAQHK